MKILIAILATICVMMGTVGCDGQPTPVVDVSNAEFSDAEDYQQYDLDLRESARGQAP